MIKHDNKKIILPALRARMGDWIYYISYMSMAEIANRVGFAQDIHESPNLNDLLQRRLTNASKDIAKYLENQEQRFFNSIIIGVYEGDPKFFEISLKKSDEYDKRNYPEELRGSIGLLNLNGKEILFAIDGQHRVSGIHNVVKKKDALKNEEVSVIFVSAKQDKENKQRTRRLFTTLNRYAKPVKLRDIIALDEDDLVAIITRRMLNEYSLFKEGTINTKVKGKNIPSTDNSSITTIETLYESLNIILTDKTPIKWKEFKALRPEDDVIEEYYSLSVSFWNNLIKFFKQLKSIKDKKGSVSVRRWRNENGGHLIFRPIGLLIVSRVIKLALKNGLHLEETIKRISKLPLKLSDQPWTGLLWNARNKNMITDAKNQRVAEFLMYYMINGDLSKTKIKNISALKNLYAGAKNIPIGSQVTLPRKRSFN